MVTIARSIQHHLTRKILFRACTPYTKSYSSAAGLDLVFKDDIAVIKMSKKDNRINATFLKEFNALLDEVEESKTCKGLITTGEGKFYSNGIDLEWCMQLKTKEEGVAYLQDLNKFLLRIVMFPMPTLAMINGHSFAGGAMVASAHDLRVMNTDKGWFCLNEVFLKIKFSEVMFTLLKIKLGGGKNLGDALVLGRRYTAEEALENRIIHAAMPGTTQEEQSIKLLKTFIGKDGIPRDGVSIMKSHIYEPIQKAYEAELSDGYKSFSTQFMNATQPS